MSSNELEDFIDKVSLEIKKIHIKKRGFYDQEKDNLSQMIKLTEELGELGNEVLAFNNYQREEKMAKHNTETLESEFADVLFSLLVLARNMDIDMEKAVNQKMKKIKERFNIN